MDHDLSFWCSSLLDIKLGAPVSWSYRYFRLGCHIIFFLAPTQFTNTNLFALALIILSNLIKRVPLIEANHRVELFGLADPVYLYLVVIAIGAYICIAVIPICVAFELSRSVHRLHHVLSNTTLMAVFAQTPLQIGCNL